MTFILVGDDNLTLHLHINSNSKGLELKGR